jgi:hypothetical protein
MTPAPEDCPSAGTLKTDPPVPVKTSKAWDGSDHLQRAAGAVSSRGGRADVIAGIRSSLPAALYGPSSTRASAPSTARSASILDDEHDPGGLGFGGDVPDTLLKRGRWPTAYPLAVLALEEAGKGLALCRVMFTPDQAGVPVSTILTGITAGNFMRRT